MTTAWLFFISAASLAVARKQNCRCLYGQPCWPNDAAIGKLASQVSLPLIHPTPPESACYPVGEPSGNCSDVIANTNFGRWRSGIAGSMQSPNFERYIFQNGTIEACYLNTFLGFPCGQGSVPVLGIDARSASDVQAGVKFAAMHNLRLVIKNTGHDYLGRSAARGSFVIWTHNLKDITYYDMFVPEGASDNETYKALTVGAGVQWYEAYDAAQKNGRFVVGALSASGSVGASGGWIMGGGHSAFSSRHGLGVDNALQFTVVTALGEHLTVNSHQHSDLFWALRGGGGGTYAVVLSTTYRTHDEFPLTTFTLTTNFTSLQIAKKVVTEFVRMHPPLARAQWGGYSYLSPQALTAILVAPNISVDVANITMGPFIDYVKNAIGYNSSDPSLLVQLESYDSFHSFNIARFSNGATVGVSVELGSRLIPNEMAESDPEKVADIILSLPDFVSINFVAGGNVTTVHPDAAGIHPDWRKAVAHVWTAVVWEEGTPVSQLLEIRQRMRRSLGVLSGLGMATYFNEASLYESNPTQTFFGSHYRRLKSIKKKYDPRDLFIVAGGVGSDDWDSSLNCRIS